MRRFFYLLKNKRGPCQIKTNNCCRPISSIDCAYASANRIQEHILVEGVSQSAVRFQMMIKPSKNMSCAEQAAPQIIMIRSSSQLVSILSVESLRYKHFPQKETIKVI